MRHTHSHTGNRRSQHALKAKNLTICANCKQKKETHVVCMNCGFYRGRKVIDLVKKAEKKQTKKSKK